MNKLLTKAAKLLLGLSLAAGVGVVIGNNNVATTFADGETTVTKSAADLATEHSWVSGTQYLSWALDNHITVTNGGQNGANSGKYYSTSPGTWRCYTNDIITIAAESGYLIDSITLTTNSGAIPNVTSGTSFTVNSSSWSSSAMTATVQVREFSVTYHQDSGSGQTDPLDGASGTILFGSASGSTKIDSSSVSGSDNLNQTWSVSVAGNTGNNYSQNSSYSQIGVGSTNSVEKWATSVTITTTLPDSYIVSAFSTTVGGFSGTAGSISLKVNSSEVGSGSFNGSNDVTVNASNTTSTGSTLTVLLTGGSNGRFRLKVYSVSYTLTAIQSGLTDRQITFSHNNETVSIASVTLGTQSNTSYTIQNISESNCSITSGDTDVATVSNGVILAVGPGSTTITISKQDDATYHYLSASIGINVIAPEPSTITGQTLSAFFADSAGNGKQRYEVTGVVSSWYQSNSDGTQYGNFYVQEQGNTSVSYLIYGATATSSALAWVGLQGSFVFTNPRDFLTDPTTSAIKIGDIVTMELTRNDHQGTLQGCGIITNVVEGVTPDYPEPALIETTLAGFIGASEQDYTRLYQFSAKVKSLSNDKYGNMVLTDGTNDLTVYGCTATDDALAWGSATGKYSFTNPQDFLTDDLTKTIVVNDTVEVQFIRYLHNNVLNAQGLILSVTHAPTISLSESSLSLHVGDTEELTATIQNAQSATVTWSSNDTSVATVSNGEVTAEGIGTCSITASITVYGDTYSASCSVTVSAAPIVINAEGIYTLVTDEADLAANDIVIITNNNGSIALSTTQETNYRGTTSTNISNGEITISGSTSIQALLLETYIVDNKTCLAFNTGSGYLYAPSSSDNYLRTESILDDNGKFIIDIEDDVATVTAQGNYTHNILRYNSGSPRFACYASGQQAVCIYKKGSGQIDPTKPTSVSISSATASVGVGYDITLEATINPTGTAIPSVASWLSDDTSVATVSGGTVHGVAEGTAVITAFADENTNGLLDSGEKSATCTVSVVNLTYGFFYQVTDASTLNANDKVVLAVHDGNNVHVMTTTPTSGNKMPTEVVDVSSRWTDTFGSSSIKSFRINQSVSLWTLGGSSSGWTFANGSVYLKAPGNSTDLNTNATAGEFTLSAGSYGTFRMQSSTASRAVAYQTATSVFGHYATSNIKDDGAYYDIEIYKLVESVTSLGTLTCTGNGSYTGDWSSFTTAFTNLSLGEKAYYKHASYSSTGVGTETTVAATYNTFDAVAQFVAKYDYIVAKYGTTSNPDFIGRNPAPLGGSKLVLNSLMGENTNTIATIVIISLVSVTAIGGYFFIKRREEN